MGVSYKKLWKLLIDKDMKKGDLCEKANVSGTSLAKLFRGENVNTDTLVRICSALNCEVSDIMEILPDDETKSHPKYNGSSRRRVNNKKTMK